MCNWPFYTDEEIEAVVRVLRSGRVNYWNGEEGKFFEREFAAYHEMPHAIALANGTVALELALHALEIGEGDEVVVTPRSFMASVSCVVARGATPVFADVDPESGNLTPESVSAVLSSHTRAVIAVHLAGWPCDLDGLRRLCDERGLKLIEDCAQAHGASWQGRPVGSVGDAAAFSFCTDKIISTGGEGGMLLLKDEAAWQRAWSYKDHGKSWSAVHGEHPPGFRWLHGSFGTNWRMTEMQAAIGRIQLRKLPEWLVRRRENAAFLGTRLEGLPGLRVPRPPAGAQPAWYKFYAFIKPERLRPGWDRDAVAAAIQACGVTCLHGGCSEIYREQAFDGTVFRPASRLPVARWLGETSLMLLVDHTQTRSQLTAVVQALEQTMEEACHDDSLEDTQALPPASPAALAAGSGTAIPRH